MKLQLCIASTLALAATASAQVVAVDNFSYTGELTSNGWAAHSGAGNRPINSDGSVTTLDFRGGSGEDISLPCAQFADDATCYASFTLNVPSGSPVDPDNNGSYFAHFKDVSFGFRARTGLMSPAANGDYGIGINASSSSIGGGAVWASDLLFDTNYQVVINFDALTGTSQLWIDPTSSASTSVSHTGSQTGTIINNFSWRQASDHTGLITVDNLVVGGSFADVTVVDTANSFLAAETEPGCNGLVLHYTSSTTPPSPSSPATWAAGSSAVLTVTNMDDTVSIGVLVFGNSSVNLPLFGGQLLASPDVIQVVAGSAGQASVPLTIPAGLGGAAFYTQFAAFDSCVSAGSFAFSNAQQHILP
ncbi:hypothetical protein N9B90_00205 [bacterium]|nr:hypothetical protein [bacterium]